MSAQTLNVKSYLGNSPEKSNRGTSNHVHSAIPLIDSTRFSVKRDFQSKENQYSFRTKFSPYPIVKHSDEIRHHYGSITESKELINLRKLLSRRTGQIINRHYSKLMADILADHIHFLEKEMRAKRALGDLYPTLSLEFSESKLELMALQSRISHIDEIIKIDCQKCEGKVDFSDLVGIEEAFHRIKAINKDRAVSPNVERLKYELDVNEKLYLIEKDKGIPYPNYLEITARPASDKNDRSVDIELGIEMELGESRDLDLTSKYYRIKKLSYRYEDAKLYEKIKLRQNASEFNLLKKQYSLLLDKERRILSMKNQAYSTSFNARVEYERMQYRIASRILDIKKKILQRYIKLLLNFTKIPSVDLLTSEKKEH